MIRIAAKKADPLSGSVGTPIFQNRFRKVLDHPPSFGRIRKDLPVLGGGSVIVCDEGYSGNAGKLEEWEM